MKNKSLALVTLALLGVAGCATPERAALLRGVGPQSSTTHPANWSASGAGFLQVYSAKEQFPTSPGGSDFASNSEFGNNSFQFRDAHTAYTIYGADGQLIEHVQNAKDSNDATPTRVSLAPGSYQIKAEALDFNNITSTVLVPVCIEAGLTTQIHLDGNWSPQLKGQPESQWVRLSNGSVVGFHCAASEGLNAGL